LLKVPAHYWVTLSEKEGDALQRDPLVEPHPNGFILRFLNEDLLLDLDERCLKSLKGNQWESFSYPLLELISLVYLLHASSGSPDGTLVSAAELKTAHFFQGPHELKVGSLIRRYGHDVKGFRERALSLGGETLEMADAAYKLPALPKVPLYYLLWEGDDEFEPNLSILFDRTVEQHLPADGIWGLVSLASDALLRGTVIS
jgi:hypothetical protein